MSEREVSMCPRWTPSYSIRRLVHPPITSTESEERLGSVIRVRLSFAFLRPRVLSLIFSRLKGSSEFDSCSFDAISSSFIYRGWGRSSRKKLHMRGRGNNNRQNPLPGNLTCMKLKWSVFNRIALGSFLCSIYLCCGKRDKLLIKKVTYLF